MKNRKFLPIIGFIMVAALFAFVIASCGGDDTTTSTPQPLQGTITLPTNADIGRTVAIQSHTLNNPPSRITFAWYENASTVTTVAAIKAGGTPVASGLNKTSLSTAETANLTVGNYLYVVASLDGEEILSSASIIRIPPPPVSGSTIKPVVLGEVRGNPAGSVTGNQTVDGKTGVWRASNTIFPGQNRSEIYFYFDRHVDATEYKWLSFEMKPGTRFQGTAADGNSPISGMYPRLRNNLVTQLGDPFDQDTGPFVQYNCNEITQQARRYFWAPDSTYGYLPELQGGTNGWATIIIPLTGTSFTGIPGNDPWGGMHEQNPIGLPNDDITRTLSVIAIRLINESSMGASTSNESDYLYFRDFTLYNSAADLPWDERLYGDVPRP